MPFSNLPLKIEDKAAEMLILSANLRVTSGLRPQAIKKFPEKGLCGKLDAAYLLVIMASFVNHGHPT